MFGFGKEFDEVTDLLDIIGELVKDGTDLVIKVGGKDVRIVKKDGKITVLTGDNLSDGKTCDKEVEKCRKAKLISDVTKRRALEFKNKMNSIDDCTFMLISDELAKKMNLNKFSQFLDLDEYDEDDAKFMDKILTYTSNVIKKNINNRINELQKLFNEF